ncbi:diaminopropionate ammonia-lyase [Allosaccharopolyspora coralli]|uniref:Diaminopropionate ammonia-lyase n=1 Tax=Allosaccharopolyspora coralli TaxID=2665642 RepID=A0A5Q3Q823_9PSEU|nr:diaminopropionate ammonia-lyase [Allosaccharopolyspora coralli]QGK69586.1 diaminopropionate ammonia-lyase [Allosaccharopolyspora coralli]
MQPAGAYVNSSARFWGCPPPPGDVLTFHARLPDSSPTPLVELPGVADQLGVRRLFVKDKSTRLGLPAFKALGVFYAIYRVVSERTGGAVTPPTIDALRHRVASEGSFELVTATDGNHGRALARMARLIGLPAKIFVPAVVDAPAVHAIRDEGASVTVLEADYDETVRHAAADAARPDAVLVQDTSWPGYETTPQWIVDGYSTLFAEIDVQLASVDETGPNALAVPVGVGSLAQAAVTHYRSQNRTGIPTALIGVEPDTAACVQHSLSRSEITSVGTGATIMAGLNCGTPSTLAWPYLRHGLDAAMTVTDGESRAAVTDLAGLGVSSGPCGAAALAAVRTLFSDEAEQIRATLGLDNTSTVALLSTEGHRDA